MSMKKVGAVTVQEGCTSTKYDDLRPLETGTYDLYLKLPEQVQPAKLPCGCDVEAGIVCDTCSIMAEKNVTELSAYVNDFITKRFPSGLEGDIRRIIAECVLDAFHDGARWCEKTAREEAMIISVDQAAAGADRSIILSPR